MRTNGFTFKERSVHTEHNIVEQELKQGVWRERENAGERLFTHYGLRRRYVVQLTDYLVDNSTGGEIKPPNRSPTIFMDYTIMDLGRREARRPARK